MQNTRNMRVAFAGFHLESVSFLEKQVDLAAFERAAHRREDIIEEYRGSNTVPGGIIECCAASGIDVLPIVYTYQGALGPASDESVEYYLTEIKEYLSDNQGMYDGVIIHLHGASASPSYPDVEALFIEQIRNTIGKAIPFMAAFDYHGNLSEETLWNLDAAFAYKKSPHTDMAETGERAVKWMHRCLEKGEPPRMAVTSAGLVIPSIFSATSLKSISIFFKKATEIERFYQGEVDISILAGFAYSDRKIMGFSIIAVGAIEIEKLEAIVFDLSILINSQRKELLKALPLYDAQTAVTSISKRLAGASKPFLLLEHADRMNDSTYVLAELLRQKVKNVAVPFIYDKKAAHTAHQAGAGAEIDLEFGAWSSPRAGLPISVRCRVLQTGFKSYRMSGPMLTNQKVDLGMTALIEVNGITISMVSNFAFAIDADAFKIFGTEPGNYDVILLRSKTHFRHFFEPLCEEILIVDTPDWGTADLSKLPYRNLDKSNHHLLTPNMICSSISNSQHISNTQ